MRETPADVGAANVFAVAAQHREDRRERDRLRNQRTQQRWQEAHEWLRQYPEFVRADGSTCPDAWFSLIQLTHAHGRGRVTVRMVRQRVQELRASDLAHGLVDNTEGQEDQP